MYWLIWFPGQLSVAQLVGLSTEEESLEKDKLYVASNLTSEARRIASDDDEARAGRRDFDGDTNPEKAQRAWEGNLTMRYTPQNIDGVRACLEDYPGDMKVAAATL